MEVSYTLAKVSKNGHYPGTRPILSKVRQKKGFLLFLFFFPHLGSSMWFYFSAHQSVPEPRKKKETKTNVTAPGLCQRPAGFILGALSKVR
jgi:hypothetical protein